MGQTCRNLCWRRWSLERRVVRETDPTGLAKTRVYDPVGRVNEFRVGNASPAAVTRIYGPGTSYREEFRDPNQNLTVFQFDELGRRTVVTAGDGASHLAYDLLGNLTRFEDPTGAISTFRFDALSREREATPAWTTPAGGMQARVTRYDEMGNPLRIIKANGCQLDMDYDEMNRPGFAGDSNS